MLFQKIWTPSFRWTVIWHCWGNKTTTMPPHNCAVVFFKVAKFIPYFTVCTWSTIFVTSQSSCANRQNIFSSIIQSFFKQHLIKLHFLQQSIIYPFRVKKLFMSISFKSVLVLVTVTDPCSLLYLNYCPVAVLVI